MEAEYMKWETMSNDSKRTSDIDPNELDKYQVSALNMNLIITVVAITLK